MSKSNISGRQEIASLWSGYGKVIRLTHSDGSTLIRKQISAPPITADSDEGHRRKILSYEVERYFYTHIAPMVENSYLATIYDSGDDFLLMEDLNVKFPVDDRCNTTFEDEKLVMEWLAKFHASLWDPSFPAVPPPLQATSETGIWEEGSYWYLRTRTDEYNSLRANDKWRQIGTAVDAKIREIPSHFITLIHGDAKSANIVFSSNNSDGSSGKAKSSNKVKNTVQQKCDGVAMYDFQYVGRSPGVRDVVYYLVSSSNHIESREMELLQYYYDVLISALKQRDNNDRETREESNKGSNSSIANACDNTLSFTQIADLYTFETMLSHYELCMLDYVRFMKGWGMWGNSTHACKRCEDILSRRGDILCL